MPWLDDDTPQAILDAFGSRKISEWPQPDLPRIDARMRMVHGIGLPAPRAHRHVFRLRPNGPGDPTIFNCWLDAFPISDTQMQGSSGPHPVEGWDMMLTVTLYEDPPGDPTFGVTGLEYRWTFTFPGEPDWDYWQMYSTSLPAYPDGVPFELLFAFTVGPDDLSDLDKDPILNPSFPAVVRENMEWWCQSECWVFPIPPAAASAEFNGDDTSILFDGFTTTSAARLQLECDVLLRNNNFCAILARSDNTVRWVGLKPDFFQWHGVAIPLSPVIPSSVFGTFRAEFDWNAGIGSNWRCFWNGALIGTSAAGATGLFFNLMGKRGPTYVGDFDMRNLTLLDTDPAASRLLLSTELQTDACDIGIDSLKGTTENMTLASCP